MTNNETPVAGGTAPIDSDMSAAAGAASPLAGPVAAEEVEALAAAAGVDQVADLPKVRTGFIWLLFGGVFGVYLAFVTPLALSLSIRVNALQPGHPEYLGYILGIGSLAALLVGPLGGQLSDRTRSRLGRRRPWLIGGMIGGTISLVVLAVSRTCSCSGWAGCSLRSPSRR